MKYDLKGHSRSYKTTFMPKSFWHIRLWTDFDMNVNVMKTQYMTWKVTFMFWRSFVFFYFTLRPSDLITTLTYVLKDNFCPCLVDVAVSVVYSLPAVFFCSRDIFLPFQEIYALLSKVKLFFVHYFSTSISTYKRYLWHSIQGKILICNDLLYKYS